MSEESGAGASKLDSLSKDDLIKLVKKYIVLQKQLKTKNEDLTNKLAELEQKKTDATKNSTDNSDLVQINKELSFEMKKLNMQNNDLKAENSQLKTKIDALYIEMEKLNLDLKENAMFRIELEPKLENANREIELNKSMLNMLNNEIQLLNSDKLQLEKKLLHSRRNTTPCVIVEEDEEDLEEEKRNDQINNEETTSNKLNIIHEEDFNTIEESEAFKREHDRDVAFLNEKKFIANNSSTTDGILILNKQIEDMTFYIDELKSELEAEREKNNDYTIELDELKAKVLDLEKQNISISNGLNEEIQRLNKELIDALFRLKEKGLDEKSLVVTKDCVEVNESLEKYLKLIKEELIEKENFNILDSLKIIDSSNDSLFRELIEKFKLTLLQRDKRLNEESDKVKYTETQLEKIIKDFKQENENLELRLNEKIHEYANLKAQFESKIKTLQTELDTEKAKNERTDKETNKNKLLDLEIANYERSIKSLNLQHIAKDKEVNDIKNELSASNENILKLKNEIENLQKEKETFEEKSTKLKQLLVKAKKEIADAKTNESEHSRSQASLKAQMETHNIEIESYKLELANLSQEKQKLQERLNSSTEISQRASNLLEGKLNFAEDQLKECKSELASLKTEYDNYKLKAQHAFKKQKEQTETSTFAVNTNEIKGYLNEIDELKNVIIQLNDKLSLSEEKFKLLEKENYLIQDEYALSLERNTKLISELKEKEAEWKIKQQKLDKDNTFNANEKNDIIRNLNSKIESQMAIYEEKLRVMSLKNNQTINLLQSQLTEAKDDLNRLTKELNETKDTSQQSNVVSRSSSRFSPGVNESNIDHVENSKNNFILGISTNDQKIPHGDDIENLLNQSTSSSPKDTRKNSKTLEQLLNEPSQTLSPTNTFSFQSNDTKLLLNQIDQYKSDINKSKLQLEHLNELLNESELNNARLTEQINLLKEEIRRLERNQEREKSISNMEYLKNVVYKFLTFSSTQERAQLLPVLSTMLRLSQEEQNTIMSIKVMPSDSNSTNGWSNYLPKWT